jgi:hypothetical protein
MFGIRKRRIEKGEIFVPGQTTVRMISSKRVRWEKHMACREIKLYYFR